jgi:DNA uptake protein ComE-like DNA-binding protein
MNVTNGRLLRGRIAPALIAMGVLACSALAAAAPQAGGAASAPAAQARTAGKKVPPATPRRLIDINSASRKELRMLPGIGDAQADRIVAGRPYRTKTDLATGKVIPTGTYLSIKRMIVAKPPKQPNSKG